MTAPMAPALPGTNEPAAPINPIEAAVTARQAELANPTPTPVAESVAVATEPAAPVEAVPPVEGEPIPEVVADAPAEEAQPEPETTPEEPPPVEAKVVALPSSRPEEPDFELEVSDPVAHERLTQLVNMAKRTEEVFAEKREAELIRQEAQAMTDQLEVNPLGMIEDSLPPMDRAGLVCHLLADRDTLEAAKEKLEMLLDPTENPKAVAALLQLRRQHEEEARGQIALKKTVREYDAETQRLIDQVLIPDGLNDEQLHYYKIDARADIKRAIHASRNGLVEPREVPRLLAPRLRALGMTDEQIVARLQAHTRGERQPRRVTAAPVKPQAKPAATPTPPKLPSPRPIISAGAGLGAPQPSTTQIPKGTKLEDAITMREQQLARG